MEIGAKRTVQIGIDAGIRRRSRTGIPPDHIKLGERAVLS